MLMSFIGEHMAGLKRAFLGKYEIEKMLGIINGIKGERNGKEVTVDTGKRSESRQNGKKQRSRKQQRCKSFFEHVVLSIMEMGKCIFMIHGAHFHLWSANH